MNTLDKIEPRRREMVANTCNKIRSVLAFHGKKFTMADFDGHNYHVKMLREIGIFKFARGWNPNDKHGYRPKLIEFTCDKETAAAAIEDYLENTYIAGRFEAQEKISNSRKSRALGTAPETPDTPTEPVIERIGNCTIFRMSQAKHWQKTEKTTGYIPTCSTLGGNTLAMTM